MRFGDEENLGLFAEPVINFSMRGAEKAGSRVGLVASLYIDDLPFCAVIPTSINIVYGTRLIMQEPWTIGAKIMSQEMPEKPVLRAKT